MKLRGVGVGGWGGAGGVFQSQPPEQRKGGTAKLVQSTAKALTGQGCGVCVRWGYRRGKTRKGSRVRP